MYTRQKIWVEILKIYLFVSAKLCPEGWVYFSRIFSLRNFQHILFLPIFIILSGKKNPEKPRVTLPSHLGLCILFAKIAVRFLTQ